MQQHQWEGHPPSSAFQIFITASVPATDCLLSGLDTKPPSAQISVPADEFDGGWKVQLDILIGPEFQFILMSVAGWRHLCSSQSSSLRGCCETRGSNEPEEFSLESASAPEQWVQWACKDSEWLWWHARTQKTTPRTHTLTNTHTHVCSWKTNQLVLYMCSSCLSRVKDLPADPDWCTWHFLRRRIFFSFLFSFFFFSFHKFSFFFFPLFSSFSHCFSCWEGFFSITGSDKITLNSPTCQVETRKGHRRNVNVPREGSRW